MNKKRFLHLCIPLCLLGLLGACREDFDDHYESASGKSTVTENIVEILRADPDFSLFVQAIDRLELETTLGESAVYTCFAQTNEDVETWLKSKNCASIADVPEDDLAVWLNYHFVLGMNYLYDFEKKSNAVSDSKTLAFYQSNASLKSREDSKHPGKYVRVYTPAWLKERGGDYRYLHNAEVDPGSFLVEDVPVSERYDIDASNGVIHVLAAPLEPKPRADEAIAQDTSLSILHSWLERYVSYSIKGIDTDSKKIDTTKVKSYTYGADIAKESNRYTLVAPTNQAIRDLLGPFMADNFDNDYDRLPDGVVSSILKTMSVSGSWGMSDITRGIDPPNYFLGIGSVYVRMGNDIEGSYEAGLPSSNAMIYKLHKMATPPLLNSVEGGISLNASHYSNWGQAVSAKRITGLTDPLQYKHPARTILIQPDDKWSKYYSDYSSKETSGTNPSELDTLINSLYASIILLNIQDGKFTEKTYYNTSMGSIYYANNTFTDYAGNAVNLLSKEPTWSGTNGAIYEIDGFFSPLAASDTTQTIYKMCLREESDYSLFKQACIQTGLADKLELTGSFQYTVFAPTDAAMQAAQIDQLITEAQNDMTGEKLTELTEFVQRHIVRRKIFTDGAYTGVINNMNDELLTLSGSWENFRVADESGQSVAVELERSNRQGNNGAVHRITTVLKKKQ